MKELKDFPKTIKIKNDLELRFLEPTFENAQMQFDIVEKNRNHLLPWLEWALETVTKTAEDAFRFLDKVLIEWEEQKKYDFGIFHKNKYVGRFSFFDVKIKAKSCEIGYWLDKDATGKGIITDCIKVFEEMLFEQYGFNRIVIRCDKKNQSSANVAKRCGYTQEAELREERFRKDGSAVDMLLYSKLKREYKSPTF